MGAGTSVSQYNEIPPRGGTKEGPTKPRSGRRAQEAWLGGARMPQNTEWVGGICPTTLNGRGTMPYRTGWAGELRGDVEGHGGPEHEKGWP